MDENIANRKTLNHLSPFSVNRGAGWRSQTSVPLAISGSPARETWHGSRRGYGFFSVVSLTMRGAAWLTTMRSGLLFFGFFFSRLGASLFPMIAACHGFPHLARANEVPASNSPRDS
jgi:hypothetical protein